MMTALAFAALVAADERDLREQLEETAERCSDDAELLNIVEQARGEFDGQKAFDGPAEIAFFTDAIRPGESPWSRHQLRTQATQLLESAMKGARDLLRARRVPSARSGFVPTQNS